VINYSNDNLAILRPAPYFSLSPTSPREPRQACRQNHFPAHHATEFPAESQWSLVTDISITHQASQEAYAPLAETAAEILHEKKDFG
jgi:hypothetical protein